MENADTEPKLHYSNDNFERMLQKPLLEATLASSSEHGRQSGLTAHALAASVTDQSSDDDDDPPCMGCSSDYYEAEPAETPRENDAIENFDLETKVECQHVLATFAGHDANASAKELRPQISSSQASGASVNIRPVATCRTSRWTRSSSSIVVASSMVVFSEPGEAEAACLGGVVVHRRTPLHVCGSRAGPPEKNTEADWGAGKDGNDRPLQTGKDGNDRPPSVRRAGADWPAPADLRHCENPRCPCEANRENGIRSGAKSTSAGGGMLADFLRARFWSSSRLQIYSQANAEHATRTMRRSWSCVVEVDSPGSPYPSRRSTCRRMVPFRCRRD